jgi:hypothetical protein
MTVIQMVDETGNPIEFLIGDQSEEEVIEYNYLHLSFYS